MDKQAAKKRINQLKEAVSYNNYRYHVLDDPKISDAAFDSLKHELSELEEKYPDLITADSPSQRVSGQPLGKFEKAPHQVPMLSLDDVFSKEGLLNWQERIQKIVPQEKLDYFAEFKVDGFAIDLIYEKGVLKRGATRGNGQVGEDVTANIKTIESIPLTLSLYQELPADIEKKLKDLLQNGQLDIRGEVFMTNSAFEAVNKDRQAKDLEPYANPRNTAAGSIRQLNPEIAASRQLAFLAYSIVTDVGQKTHQQEHQVASALGFKVDQGCYCEGLEEAYAFFKEIEERRKKLEFQIDGVVVSVNNEQAFERLGSVGRAPRGSIALKFPAEESTTVVEDIIVQVGRTGALTPVAKLKPVKIGGTLVTRATLHNQDEIDRLDVRIGDTVIIQRAGDVIPDVVKVVDEMRTGQEKKFKMPKKCPMCNSEVIRPQGEAVHRCSNKDCGAVLKKQIYHFVSKKGFDIAGLGPKIVDQLMDQGLISDQADVFALREGDLRPLERFADKSASNLVKAIENSKEIALDRFLFALGIRYIGEETADLLAQELIQKKDISKVFDIVEAIKEFSLEDLKNIEGIGPVVGESIFEYFHNKKNLTLLEKLNKASIRLDSSAYRKREKALAGKSFVLTGELSQLTRQEAKDQIKKKGGKVVSSVSKNTDYVVAGQNPGSKYGQAQELSVKILSEDEFLKMLKI